MDMIIAPGTLSCSASPTRSPMTQRISRDRLEQALDRIADPAGEGARACLMVYAEAARAAADAADARRRAGITLGPLDGAIVSLKDLFDVAGEVTRAGSKVLAEEGTPAAADAPVVRRLRAAGAVIVAKTNMTEFAFSGVGLNPHYGTPGNPADRARVPGGSTSGGAVAVADGLCDIAIGTDTGGSTRIPAALCGIAGFKPSKRRVPTDGAFPLSCTLDSVGPMARTVADCARADAIMAGEGTPDLASVPLVGLRLGVAQGLPFKDLDPTVSARFAAAITALDKAGARLSEQQLSLFDDLRQANLKGGFAPPEAYAIHRERLERRGGEIDPNVRVRIARGCEMSASDYVELTQVRARLVQALDARLTDLDALVMPTTPIVAPKMSEVATPETFMPRNFLLLRNTAIVNFFDLCAVSLPLPRTDGLPVGLMLVGRNGHDHRLLRMAAAVEKLLSG
jgi:aspartyl-tRNA(Asn)/glutamyl-tRNA(Gln) amidotransferase subunit A